MQNNKNQSFYESLITGNNKCRNTEEQKKRFRKSVREIVGPSTKIEEVPIYKKKSIVGVNQVIGNIELAEYILLAHYDTPSVPYPDYKYSSIRYIGWRRFLSRSMRWSTISFVATFIFIIMGLINHNQIFLILILMGIILYMLSMLFYLKITKSNPNNANDNSSGVCLALHLLEKKPDKVAVILFDHEENGKKGSKSMKEKFETNSLYSDKIFINLDTVGCNDAIRIAQDKCTDIDPKMESQKVIFPERDTFEGKRTLFDLSYGDHTDFVNLPKGRRIGIETINGDPENKCTHNLGPIHSAGDTIVNPEMMERVMHLVEHIMDLNDKQE